MQCLERDVQSSGHRISIEKIVRLEDVIQEGLLFPDDEITKATHTSSSLLLFLCL